jgi:ubiquinone/menaquinone biosynthesis C-methylase UbiE
VTAIDVNPEMLEIVRRRVQEAGLADHVAVREMGVAELDGEPPACFDAVTAGLCFSELSDDEIRYALGQVRRVLRPGGLLLVTDEVEPPTAGRRLLHNILKAPLAALTYLVTQQTTHAVRGLPSRVATAGFLVEAIRSNWLGSFVELVARKREEPA